MGGDGTVHEVVNGLAYGTLLRRGSGQMPPLAIVPCGSGNTVAFTLGLATAEDALGTQSSAILAVHYSLFPLFVDAHTAAILTGVIRSTDLIELIF